MDNIQCITIGFTGITRCARSPVSRGVIFGNNMELNSLIIPFFSGVAGFVGGIFATYVKWDIEKKKIKVENRKERIKEWRTAIQEDENLDKLWGSSVHSDLKEYLTENELKTLYALIANSGMGGSGDDIKKSMLFKVITRVEKSWDLI